MKQLGNVSSYLLGVGNLSKYETGQIVVAIYTFPCGEVVRFLNFR